VTSKNLGSETFVHSFLSSWRSEMDPRLRPEFFGPGEPIRRKFENGAVEEAARLWLSDQMPVMLRRKTKPRFVADIWWRPDKGKDPRPYPWGCHVFLNRTAGDDLAQRLFSFLVDHFEPAFGMLSTREDSRAKHQLTWREGVEHVSQYMGQDVGRFVTITTDYGRDVLPGVYWVTYFGRGALEIVDEDRLEHLKADRVERIGDGYLVRAYPSASAAGSDAAHQAERKIREQLGEEHFFDKNQVDIESLKMDEVTAARAERKIEEIKATRR
jgi:hypothetical protein